MRLVRWIGWWLASMALVWCVPCGVAQVPVVGETNVTVTVMAANLTSGNDQSYEGPGIRIFQGLKPDIVAVQEFRYQASSADGPLRSLVDQAFGGAFHFYREPFTGSGDIPNGIISRWPITASGSWSSPVISNRGFAWARIDVPGSNDLYLVSVHLNTSSASGRANEATVLRSNILASFPTGAWVVVAGDLNTDTRTEAAITTLGTVVTDAAVPVDQSGNGFTSANRSKPYDYVLPSFSLATNQVVVLAGGAGFPSGLVFDSRVFSPLAALAPVVASDSGAVNMQHMGVLKSFRIRYAVTNGAGLPWITAQPESQTVDPGSNAIFVVSASGDGLAYQWQFNGLGIPGRTGAVLTVTNAQGAQAGPYRVIVTNGFGAVTSSVATLTVGRPPVITSQPVGQSVGVGAAVNFAVSVFGSLPLSYQWRLGGAALPGATSSAYTISNAQPAQAGSYSVLVTNWFGAVTSAVVNLTVLGEEAARTIAEWVFNETNGPASAPVASAGFGTAGLVGGTTATWATGTGSTDPAATNNAWNTSTYPAQGTANKTAGVQFRVDTTGWREVGIRWDQRASNTGSKYSRVQYSTNGLVFYDFSSPVSLAAATVFEAKSVSLGGIPFVGNNPDFAFRIVAEFESTAVGGTSGYVGTGGSYGTAGTLRFDAVRVSGVPMISPAGARLEGVGLSGGRCSFTVNGTPGAAYRVEATAESALGGWLPVVTNNSPYLFTEPVSSGQRYYRAVSWQ